MTDWLKRIGMGCGVVCALWGLFSLSLTVPSPTAFSQQSAGISGLNAEGLLQVHSTLLSTGIEQIVVVDPRAKSLAVYHIEPATAKLQLKSVRNLVWDLQMEHFNGQAPLPSELRQVQP
jgi:hypothetical protein